MVEIDKYHGTGNDFIVVDGDDEVSQRRQFARDYCDRETGLVGPDENPRGADGVLFLALEEEFNPPRVVMTLVNPDGSVAAMCGNGARCAAAWASERTGTEEVMIDTPAGSLRAQRNTRGVAIEMGTPGFVPAEVPVESDGPLVEETVADLTVTAVNTGVPHAVAFVEDVNEVNLSVVGPQVRYADIFPNGANVTVASRRADGGFDQRTYERGVEGETESCGTGAVAIGAVAEKLGFVETGEPVDVHPPGGRLGVTAGEQGTLLEGPVEHTFSTRITETEAASADVVSD
jgi:diaminopimelate epimerase